MKTVSRFRAFSIILPYIFRYIPIFSYIFLFLYFDGSISIAEPPFSIVISETILFGKLKKRSMALKSSRCGVSFSCFSNMFY